MNFLTYLNSLHINCRDMADETEFPNCDREFVVEVSIRDRTVRIYRFVLDGNITVASAKQPLGGCCNVYCLYWRFKGHDRMRSCGNIVVTGMESMHS